LGQNKPRLTSGVSKLMATVTLTRGLLEFGTTAGNTTCDDFGGRSWQKWNTTELSLSRQLGSL